MELYPSIDISNGKCVRLVQGDFAQETVYSIDPVVYAKNLAKIGAKWIHVVDLDGAKQGKLVQLNIIKEIVESSCVNIQVGGGVSSKEIIEELFNVGVRRVVIGTKAANNPELVTEWLNCFGGHKITLAFDVINVDGDYRVAVSGWKSILSMSLWTVLEIYKKINLFNVLCTDIKRDGMLTGPNWQLYKDLRTKFPNIYIQSSGGVSCVADLLKLKESGVSACIIGKALYENRFTLQEAIEVLNNDNKKNNSLS